MTIRENRVLAGTQQTEFGKGPHTVNEQIIAHDVQRITREESPHSGFGFGNAIGKLTQTVKQCHKNHRHQHHQIIAAYKWHDFCGLPHVVQEEIAHTHDGAEQQSKEHVGSHSLFEYASGFEFTAWQKSELTSGVDQ